VPEIDLRWDGKKRPNLRIVEADLKGLIAPFQRELGDE